jgi:hypothetical protein
MIKGGKLWLLRLVSSTACLLLSAAAAHGQQMAVKTNALYWATATPNLGFEFGAGSKSTINLVAGYNPWSQQTGIEGEKKLQHVLVKPEYRYWLWERFNGHFFGVHALYASYDVSNRNIPSLFKENYRYDGMAYGIGISYGFHLMINTIWGLEAYVGFGAARFSYDQYDCEKCNSLIDHVNLTYLGPTSAGISLIYMIK